MNDFQPVYLKCNYTNCSKKCMEIGTQSPGYCKYCRNNFCLKHRLPEIHSCSEIDKLKLENKKYNTEQLLKNKLEKVNKLNI
jgi:predicted nucleic acid binding AN1-type Zn finger protein